jgi:uncharacterized protein
VVKKGDIMKFVCFGSALAAGLALASAAHATSFDCTKASTPMEKAICASPDLSKADDTLAAAFKTTLSSLSPAGQAILRADQRAFLAHAAVICQKSGAVDADCLAGAFSDRTSGLGHAIMRLGGWTFITTTSYRGADHSLAVPQIDSSTAGTWNTWAKALVETSYDLTDETKNGKPMPGTTVTVVMSVTAASPDLISASVQSATQEDGMGAGDNRQSLATWLVRPAHQLTGKDLFDASKPWATALAPIAQKHLVDGDGNTDKAHKIKRLDQAGGDWAITAKGLSLTYDDWRSADDRPGAETDLSWAELKPFLRKDLPFDPARIVATPGN